MLLLYTRVLPTRFIPSTIHSLPAASPGSPSGPERQPERLQRARPLGLCCVRSDCPCADYGSRSATRCDKSHRFSPPTRPQPTTFFEERAAFCTTANAVARLPNRVIFDRSGRLCLSVHVRFAPKATAGRDLHFNAYADNRTLFKYVMHTPSSEISESIGGRVLFLGARPKRNENLWIRPNGH
jgi:hypothetical protein